MRSLPKIWILAEYWATSTTLEVAQNAFLESGAIGIECDDGLGPEGQKKYPDDQIKILAYFEPAPDLENIVEQQLKNFFGNCGLSYAPIKWSQFLEEDWQANFVKSCTTFMVKPNIFIVPSFEIDEFKKNPRGSLYIEMDPENAFGTGKHQTTQLCLKNIYEIMSADPKSKGWDALDIGTGSGILAILMKKLGIKHVLGTETDNDALITASQNAKKNNVDIDWLHVDEEYIYPKDHYDLVVANILAPVLIHMADNIFASCKKHGSIILSGILLELAQGVIKVYQGLGARFIRQDQKDDWCSLIFGVD
ncbi:MAG: 50S ribosomal protein L11 methyltransferase [Myxococcales bacterium]|nr:50S ribosomal protein L11 methyltransferase [Myxococcales bacterium]USN51734.1 MAG: 50S ribosomal protein L11 methyltransferase [Myxococcales bacterium]